VSSGAAAVLVCLLAVAACGGEEAAAPTRPAETTSTSVRASTVAAPSDFVDDATAICTDLEQSGTGFSRSDKPSDEEVLALIRGWRADFDRLAALDPPADVRPHFERMLLNYRRLADSMQALVEVEDETALAAVAGIALFGQRGSHAARTAGLDRCALAAPIEQPPPDAQPMYEAARELVPAGARITRDDLPTCGDDEGSCSVEFELEGDVVSGIAAARGLLTSHGWTNIRAGRSAPATRWLMANRNDYAVTVELVGRPLPSHCGRSVTFGCVDSVWIHRVEVPDVLTGG
jgi:hypothetical protein